MRSKILFFMFVIFFSSQSFAWEKTFWFSYLGQKFNVTLTMPDEGVKTCSQQIWDWQNAHGSLSNYKTDSLLQYVSFPCSNELMKSLNLQLHEIFTSHFETKKDKAQLLIAFVNSIPYQSDSKDLANGDYWQYPFETLYLDHGDCEDHAFLLTDLFRRNGFDSLILRLPTHMACAIDTLMVGTDYKTPYKIKCGAHDYYYCEAVGSENEIEIGGSKIGEVGINGNCVPVEKTFVEGKDQFDDLTLQIENAFRGRQIEKSESGGENGRICFKNNRVVEVESTNEHVVKDMYDNSERFERNRFYMGVR